MSRGGCARIIRFTSTKSGATTRWAMRCGSPWFFEARKRRREALVGERRRRVIPGRRARNRRHAPGRRGKSRRVGAWVGLVDAPPATLAEGSESRLVPFVRFSRDRRGYEHVYLIHIHSSGRRGQPSRAQMLYWFRTPPGIKVGRRPFDPDMQRALEAQNPGLAFDWPGIIATPMPLPRAEVEHWRKRRGAERAVKRTRQVKHQETAAAPVEGAAGDGEERSADVDEAAVPTGVTPGSEAPGESEASGVTPSGVQAGATPPPARRRRRRGGRGAERAVKRTRQVKHQETAAAPVEGAAGDGEERSADVDEAAVPTGVTPGSEAPGESEASGVTPSGVQAGATPPPARRRRRRGGRGRRSRATGSAQGTAWPSESEQVAGDRGDGGLDRPNGAPDSSKKDE